MKISCQSCHSKYNVADEKVQGKVVKIRCRKCGATIVVNASGAVATNGPAAAPAQTAQAAVARAADAPRNTDAAGEGGEWHVSIADNDQRTMTLTELVNAYNTGVVVQDTFIWTEGMQDWKALGEVDAVVSALHAAAGAAPAVAVGEYSYNPPVAAVATPAYEPAAHAPVFERTAAYGGGFSAQVATAAAPAAAAAPAPEPKRAAVVRRESRARDLFATRTGEEAQTGQAVGALDGDDSRLTGQRNENSVLFSLEHLTRSAEGRSAPGETTATHDDSGIIDLKALAAKAESMRPPQLPEMNAPGAPLGFAPSAFTAPIGGLGPIGSEAVPKSKLPLLIAGGAGIGLLLVLGIVIGLKIGGAVSPAPAPAMAFPLPSATATATADPSASAAASAAAQASASAAPVAAATGKPRPYGGGAGGAAWHGAAGGGKPGAGAASGMSGTAAAEGGANVSGGTGGGAAAGAGAGGTPAAATPPKKGDCGCNGDLMCLMKCSTH
jgi:predicted Zn finger-like uncharacterized protein